MPQEIKARGRMALGTQGEQEQQGSSDRGTGLPSPPLEAKARKKGVGVGVGLAFRTHKKKKPSRDALASPASTVTTLLEQVHVRNSSTSSLSSTASSRPGHRRKRSSKGALDAAGGGGAGGTATGTSTTTTTTGTGAVAISHTTIPQPVLPGEKRLYCRVVPMQHRTQTSIPGLADVVMINDDYNPIVINSAHFTGHAVFRVKGFRGLTPLEPRTGEPRAPLAHSAYFGSHRRTFSLQVSGRFRRAWGADDVMFGTFFERPVHLPPFHQVAIAFAKKIDASMDGDLACAQPYMCSPLLCAMNVARADALGPEALAVDATECDPRAPLLLPPWPYGGALHLQENFMATVPEWRRAHARPGAAARRASLSGFFSRARRDAGAGDAEDASDAGHAENSTNDPSSHPPCTPAQRRAWFLKPENRAAYSFDPATLYSFDFNNQYVDLNTMTLKLGLTFDVAYYLNGQPVRYQMRSRDGSVVFFTIELGLV